MEPLVDTVKTRNKREKTGGKWAKYSLRSVAGRELTKDQLAVDPQPHPCVRHPDQRRRRRALPLRHAAVPAADSESVRMVWREFYPLFRTLCQPVGCSQKLSLLACAGQSNAPTWSKPYFPGPPTNEISLKSRNGKSPDRKLTPSVSRR